MGKPTLTSNAPAAPQDVLQAIIDATSQDPLRIQSSTDKLKQLEECLGAWDLIHQVAFQRDLPLEVRQMAIIQFKNGALSRWKSRKLFLDEHRSSIRQRSFALIDERDDTIADVNAIIISKIARADYPVVWPTLAIDLANALASKMETLLAPTTFETATVLTLCRILRVIGQTIKEVASMKMLTGPRAMQGLLETFHPLLLNFYSTIWTWVKPKLTVQNLSEPVLVNCLKILHLIFKSVSRLMSWLWARVDKKDYSTAMPTLEGFFQSFIVQWNYLSTFRRTAMELLVVGGSTLNELCITLLSKHIQTIGKAFRKWQRVSGPRFTNLPQCLDFVMGYWETVIQASQAGSAAVADSPLAIYPLRFVVLGMALFKESLSQWSSLRTSNGMKALSQEHVENAIEVLITRFLPLNSQDLHRWLDDPEEWANVEDKENEVWEFEIRPCSERVLITLVNQYPQFVVPILQSAFAQTLNSSASTLPQILQKEALYCALGCCSTSLKHAIDFKVWLEKQLVHEVLVDEPDFRILKRRIGWLIGRWVGGSDGKETNGTVWQILRHLVRERGSSSDPVVRMTAAVAIKECVDTIHFDVELFTPFLGDIIPGLIDIIDEAETVESKRRVLNSLNTTIERAGIQIVPHSFAIINALPKFWSQAENDQDFLFKGALLSTMTHLVQSTREHAQELMPIVVPLLRESLSPKNKVELDQDSLALWAAATRNASSLVSVKGEPALIDLFPFALEYLAENLEILGTTLSIIESYFLLDVTRVLTMYADSLFTALCNAMSRAVVTNIKDLILSLNLMLTIAPVNLWLQPMLTTGLFAALLENVLEDKLSALTLTEHIYVFSRICLQDAISFIQLIVATAVARDQDTSSILNDLLDQWWIKFDNMSEPRHRKLTAMGIAALIATGREEVLKRLPTEIFNMWLDCFGEIRESASPQRLKSPVALYWQNSEAALASFLANSEGTLEEMRRTQLFQQDPVQSAKLTEFVAMKLSEAEAACGGPQAFQTAYIDAADPVSLAQIRSELAPS